MGPSSSLKSSSCSPGHRSGVHERDLYFLRGLEEPPRLGFCQSRARRLLVSTMVTIVNYGDN